MKKIAIIGTTSSLIDAPYKDPEWEIWGLNGAYQAIPRWDRWFDMHSIDTLKKYHESVYFDFLKKAGDKVSMVHSTEELPQAKAFPWQELVKKYGRYFNNTVSWLIAYAIEQNPAAIGLWGINMAMDEEYGIQRPSCEYFLGVAEGKGIDVFIPETSEIMKCSFLYGVEPIPSYIKKMPDKKRELTNNYNEVMGEIDQGQGYMNYINGYMQAMTDSVKHFEEKLPDTSGIIKELHEKKTDFYKPEALKTQKQLEELLTRKSYCHGALDLHSYNMKNWGY